MPFLADGLSWKRTLPKTSVAWTGRPHLFAKCIFGKIASDTDKVQKTIGKRLRRRSKTKA
jgi:hypothetical protein